jgi:hypothetical protein
MELFPITELTDTEKNLLAEAISNPVVQKYLKQITYSIGRDIVTAIPDPNEVTEEWFRKEIYLKGQLTAIKALLSIQPLPKQ